MNISDVLQRLNGVKRAGEQWLALCPVHRENTPSLTVKVGADGKVLTHCFGCGAEHSAVMEALGLIDDEKPRPSEPLTQPEGKAFAKAADAIKAYNLGKPSAKWIYTKDKQPVLVVCRWVGRDGKKQIRPVAKIGDLWYMAHLPAPRPLYQGEALPPSGPIYVVEGEKCADAATAKGLFSVTSAGGANAATKADWSPLKGRDIVIFPDNDQPGQKYASEVADLVKGVGAKSCKIVNLPNLFVGEDIADWLDKGGQASEIAQLVDQAPYLFEQADQPAQPTKGFDNFKRWPELYRLTQGGEIDPLPIIPERPSSERFPEIDLHPVIEAVHQISQAPYTLCAQSVLAVMSVSTQHLSDIAIPGLGDAAAQPLSCYFVSVAQSGERKSTVDRLASLGLYEWQRQLEAAYKAEKLAHAEAMWRWTMDEADRKKSQSGPPTEPPPPPKEPILQLREPTQEGLFRALKVGQLSQGLLNDEGGTFLGGFAMAKEQRMRTVSSLNKLWDGGELDRARAGEYDVLRGRRLSLHLQIQPKASADLLADGMLTDLGFSARCLVAEPETTVGSRFRTGATNPRLYDIVRWFADRIKTCLQHKPAVDDDGNLQLPTLQLDRTALLIWNDFYNEIERMMPAHKEIWGWLNKAPQHALRLAANFTMFQDPRATHIPPSALEQGISLVRFYLSEQLRANAARPSEAEEQAESLLRWIVESGDQQVSLRDICRKGPTKLRKADIAKRTVQMLVQLGHLQPLPGRGQTFAVASVAATVATSVAAPNSRDTLQPQGNPQSVASVASVAAHQERVSEYVSSETTQSGAHSDRDAKDTYSDTFTPATLATSATLQAQESASPTATRPNHHTHLPEKLATLPATNHATLATDDFAEDFDDDFGDIDDGRWGDAA